MVASAGRRAPSRSFDSSPRSSVAFVICTVHRISTVAAQRRRSLGRHGIDISHKTVQFSWTGFADVHRRVRQRHVARMRGSSPVALALGQGVCEDQRQALLSGTRSTMKAESWRRWSPRAGQGCGAELLRQILKTMADRRASSLTGFARLPRRWKNAAPDRHEVGRRLDIGAENRIAVSSRERAMQQFRSMKTLQKISSVHAQVRIHFDQERHLVPAGFSGDARLRRRVARTSAYGVACGRALACERACRPVRRSIRLLDDALQRFPPGQPNDGVDDHARLEEPAITGLRLTRRAPPLRANAEAVPTVGMRIVDRDRSTAALRQAPRLNRSEACPCATASARLCVGAHRTVKRCGT